MSDRSRILIGRIMSGIGLVSGLVGLVWLLFLGIRGILWQDWMVHNFLIALAAGVIVWLVIGSQPRHTAIWILAWSSLFTGLEVLTYAVSMQAIETLGLDKIFFDLVPSEIPVWLALITMQANWLWVGVLLVITVLYVVPDGDNLSPFARILFRANIAVIALTAFGLFWEARPTGQIPLRATQDTHGGFASVTSSLVTIGYPLSFILALGGFVLVVLRYRRSSGLERQQLRWLAWGGAVAAFATVGAMAVDEIGGRINIALYLGALGFGALMTSLGMAIGKYRLYDIDVVINRSVVFGALAVFITGVYVAIVVGLGNLIGDPSNLGLAIAATALVAILFEPVRSRVQHWANVWVYGQRATPYEVLAGMTISDLTPTEQLAEGTRLLGEATGAGAVAVWSLGETPLSPITYWPEQVDIGVQQWDLQEEIQVDDIVVGSVGVAKARGEAVSGQDRKLIDEFLGQAGLLLSNIQLNKSLARRLEDIAESRRRVVATQDETRRKLERDLHDGAQQQLVALKVKLGLARTVAQREGADGLAETLDDVVEETDAAVQSLRDLARGVYPPLLEAEGLVTAIQAQASRTPLDVRIRAGNIGRYPRDVEVAVYFCVLEALGNALKHSGAGEVTVSLDEHDGALSFAVIDEGSGFDTSAPSSGTGFQGMADRVDTLGGELEVSSTPGEGTSVEASIPLVAEATRALI